MFGVTQAEVIVETNFVKLLIQNALKFPGHFTKKKKFLHLKGELDVWIPRPSYKTKEISTSLKKKWFWKLYLHMISAKGY